MREHTFFRLSPFFFAAVAACAAPDPVDPGMGSGSDDPGESGFDTATPGDLTHPGQPPVAAACDYTEQDDTSNDYLADTGYVLEQSGITFDTTVQRTICGKINHGHFDDYWYSVDVDNYGVAMAQEGDVVVTLTGEAEAINSVGVYAYSVDSGDSFGSYFYGDHGVFTAHLPAGHYEFSVEAYDDVDALADIDYKIRINLDHPSARCGRVTHFPDYVEQYDGASSVDNDVFDVDYALYPAQYKTSSATDQPEAAGMTMVNPTHYRIWGMSEPRTAQDSYLDRDTYSVTTGPDINQLSIRLNWSSQDADFDYYVFAEGYDTVIGKSTQVKLGEDEYATFPVLPNSTYWVWVGASTNSSQMPADYDVSLCPQTFTAM